MREARIAIVQTRTPHESRTSGEILDEFLCLIRTSGVVAPDLVLVTEMFANAPRDANDARHLAEPIDGPIVSAMQGAALSLGSYLVFGLLRVDGPEIRNSAVVLGRDGRVVGVYDKVRPTPDEMGGLGVTPGRTPFVLETELGTVGIAICFDVNFVELADHYRRAGVELLLVPTAFAAGRWLDHWALRYGFHVASSSYYAGSRLVDPCGATLAATSDLLPAVTARTNLDSLTVHMDGNLGAIAEAVRRYGRKIELTALRDEGIVVLRSLTDRRSAREIAVEFGMEPIDRYFDRSRETSIAAGGWRY